jgi:predicted AAA+ superfamily ATPase
LAKVTRETFRDYLDLLSEALLIYNNVNASGDMPERLKSLKKMMAKVEDLSLPKHSQTLMDKRRMMIRQCREAMDRKS